MATFSIARLSIGCEDVEADSLQDALGKAGDTVFGSGDVADYFVGDQIHQGLIADLFNGAFAETERGNNLFTLDNQMAAWINLVGNLWLEVTYAPSNYPCLNVRTVVMTEEQLTVHIHSRLDGWEAQRINIEAVELDDNDCVKYKPSPRILKFLGICVNTLTGVETIGAANRYLTKTDHQMLAADETPSDVEWNHFRDWLINEHGWDDLDNEPIADILKFIEEQDD